MYDTDETETLINIKSISKNHVRKIQSNNLSSMFPALMIHCLTSIYF